MNIALVVGVRPEYMKMWPIYRAFERRGLRPSVVATGQHRKMVEQHQSSLDMPLDLWLLEEQPNMPLDVLYGLLYDVSCQFVRNHQPKLDTVFLVGDTSSSLAMAQACFHNNIKIAHVESGVRSGDLRRPFPEEFNRIAIDTMASYLFCPTGGNAYVAKACNPNGHVKVTGNTIIDAVKKVLGDLGDDTTYSGEDRYILLDLHRRETSPSTFEALVRASVGQAKIHDRLVVWPAHLNPDIIEITARLDFENLAVIPPQMYHDFVRLMKGADLILTDSGGVVEEAIAVGTPTLQLRDCTDRMEAVTQSFSWLASTNPKEVSRLLKIAIPYAQCWKEWMSMNDYNPYGNGDAGEKSVEFFLEVKRDE